MNLSLVTILTTLKPAIYIAAMVPFFIAIIMWVVFYVRYDIGKLNKIRESIKMLADDGEQLKDSKRENISFMDEMVVRMAPPYFLEAWLRMQIQLEKNYKGDMIPDGQFFYEFDAMVTDPGCRFRLDFLWKSFWVLGIITVLLPLGVAFFIQPKAVWMALAFGGLHFVLLCLGNLIFTLLDQKIYFSTKTEYNRFISTFDRVLPVAKADVVLLLEATQRNKETFQTATRNMVDKLDNIVDDMLLPALMDSISVIMHSNLIPAIHNIEKTLDLNMSKTLELQEKGMEHMTQDFAARLGDTLEAKMVGLASTIGEVQVSFQSLNQSMRDNVQELNQTMAQTLDLQKNSMENISDSFADSLTNTLDTRMAGLGITIGGIQRQMEELNLKLSTNIGALSEMLSGQRQVLEESTQMLIHSGEVQEKTLEETKEIQSKSLENNNVMNMHLELMTGTLEKMTAQTTLFSKEAFQFTKETNEVQMRMSEDVKLSQGKLEAAVNETMGQYTKMNSMISDMMDNITDRMNDAMANAGREIALGIRDVTADNAEAIANLAEQALNLKNDYDIYFTRLEDSTLQSMEDMNYQVTGIISRITEDVGSMMKDAIEANGDVLDKYREGTTDLLQSFDEQSRSLALYAKEINLDISDLSNNLQVSVGEFADKMQEGVRVTLSEFDSGLSELTLRIANTVESISDAVEGLPAALGKK